MTSLGTTMAGRMKRSLRLAPLALGLAVILMLLTGGVAAAQTPEPTQTVVPDEGTATSTPPSLPDDDDDGDDDDDDDDGEDSDASEESDSMDSGSVSVRSAKSAKSKRSARSPRSPRSSNSNANSAAFTHANPNAKGIFGDDSGSVEDLRGNRGGNGTSKDHGKPADTADTTDEPGE